MSDGDVITSAVRPRTATLPYVHADTRVVVRYTREELLSLASAPEQLGPEVAAAICRDYLAAVSQLATAQGVGAKLLDRIETLQSVHVADLEEIERQRDLLIKLSDENRTVRHAMAQTAKRLHEARR